MAYSNQVGLVYAWGKGIDGQLGIGKPDDISQIFLILFTNKDKETPTEVKTLINAKIRQVGCGQSFSIAISGNFGK